MLPGDFMRRSVVLYSAYIRNAVLPSVRDAQFAQISVHRFLEQSRVRLSNHPAKTLLDVQASKANTDSQLVGATSLLEVNKPHLPAQTKAFVNTWFMLHPALPQRLDLIHKYGFALVIDPTLPLFGKKTYGYTDIQQKIVAVAPNAKWHTLQHEFNHAWLECEALRYVGGYDKVPLAEMAITNDPKLCDIALTGGELPNIQHIPGDVLPTLQSALSMIKRGYTKV